MKKEFSWHVKWLIMVNFCLIGVEVNIIYLSHKCISYFMVFTFNYAITVLEEFCLHVNDLNMAATNLVVTSPLLASL